MTARVIGSSPIAAAINIEDYIMCVPFPPTGRLSLVPNSRDLPVVDTSSNIIYYLHGSYPVFDGAAWHRWIIPNNLFLALNTKLVAGTKRDIFITFIGPNTPILGAGPAWPASDFINRNISYRDGIRVNTNNIILDTDDTNNITVLANQAVWIGSINIVESGILKFLPTYGQNRRCDLWNVYEQTDILLLIGTALNTPTWTPTNQYNTVGFVPWGNNPSNKGIIFTGAPTNIDLVYHQNGFIDSRSGPNAHFAAILWDTTIKGSWGQVSSDNLLELGAFNIEASHVERGSIGDHLATMIGAGANTFTGVTVYGATTVPGRPVDAYCVMRATYKG